MSFPTQLLHQADVPLTSNEGSNQFPAFAGQITQIPNSVSWPSGFGEIGTNQIKRSIFSVAVSSPVRHRTHSSKQTHNCLLRHCTHGVVRVSAQSHRSHRSHLAVLRLCMEIVVCDSWQLAALYYVSSAADSQLTV